MSDISVMMEDEYMKLQKLEMALKSDKGKLQVLIDAYSTSVVLYLNEEKLQELIDETEKIIMEIAATGQVRGKMMSKKAMDLFLEQSKRSQRKQRTIDLIDRANSKRAQERLSLYVDELLREQAIMKSDIVLFRKRAALAGLSKKETNKKLVNAALNKAGPVQDFGKRMKSLEIAVLRREEQARELDEYRKAAKLNEKWQWITVSHKVCPDCHIRAGVIMDLNMWENKGIPGSGQTICGSYCMCKLVPVSISEELFPDVKQFKWNKESGVLTTAGDMRSFGAKGNQP